MGLKTVLYVLQWAMKAGVVEKGLEDREAMLNNTSMWSNL